MLNPVSLRVLICDPDKASCERLCGCLQDYPLTQQPLVKGSADDLLKTLEAGECNLLFIDPLGMELGPTSRLIFQIRETLPQVITCLYVRSSEIRRRMEEFYAGERERFGHYFQLDKDLASPSFEGEAALMMRQCSAAARSLSRNPRRIELSNRPPFAPENPSAALGFYVQPQRAKEALLPAGMTEPLPAAGFLSSLRGLKRAF